jgi:hypothetical protein
MYNGFWCSYCKQQVDAVDAYVTSEKEPTEFWGSMAAVTQWFYSCPECQDELEDYEGQDAEGEADDEQA